MSTARSVPDRPNPGLAPLNRPPQTRALPPGGASPAAVPIAPPLWLVRPRSDGGCDYVSFRQDRGAVEMREGSHLPPQMPLLKRRCRLPAEEAELCRSRLQKEAGFRHSDPLF